MQKKRAAGIFFAMVFFLFLATLFLSMTKEEQEGENRRLKSGVTLQEDMEMREMAFTNVSVWVTNEEAKAATQLLFVVEGKRKTYQIPVMQHIGPGETAQVALLVEEGAEEIEAVVLTGVVYEDGTWWEKEQTWEEADADK